MAGSSPHVSRAVRLPAPSRDYEAEAFALFGVEAADEGDPPVAAVTRALGLSMIGKSWWLRADPGLTGEGPANSFPVGFGSLLRPALNKNARERTPFPEPVPPAASMQHENSP